MRQTFNLCLTPEVLAEYGGWGGLAQEVEGLRSWGVDGVEGIWGGVDIPPGCPQGLMQGYHLTFFPDWLDFYREDKAALQAKFGSLEVASRFYGGWGREYLLQTYRADLARAAQFQPRYLVFHISDVSLEEGYTYRWLHSNGEIIEAALEVINELLADYSEAPWEFLVENQWWPGFTFTEPRLTERLLAGIQYPRKGIVLDFGHLLNTNLALRTEAEGAAYIQDCLARHGSLAEQVRCVHLHQSLSGAYVQACIEQGLPDWPQDYWQRYAVSYGHILQIDRHLPWSSGQVLRPLAMLPRLAYLTHELAAGSAGQRRQRVQGQAELLKNFYGRLENDKI